MMGRGDQAFEYYKKLMPNRIDSDIFQAEPYVYSQYTTSDEHPTAGKTSHSWQTGTAAWMYRVVFDYMFGVRATYSGLLIDPVITSDWESFKIERVFRGTRYIIEVDNSAKVEHGVKSIEIDGQQITGNILPHTDKEECFVKVVMSK